MDQLMTTLDLAHGAYDEDKILEEPTPAHPLYAYAQQRDDEVEEPDALDAVILAGLVTP